MHSQQSYSHGRTKRKEHKPRRNVLVYWLRHKRKKTSASQAQDTGLGSVARFLARVNGVANTKKLAVSTETYSRCYIIYAGETALLLLPPRRTIRAAIPIIAKPNRMMKMMPTIIQDSRFFFSSSVFFF